MPNTGSNFQYYLYDMLSEIRSRMQRTKLLSVYTLETDVVTIDPSSYWEYLEVSGAGRLFYMYHYSKGIIAGYAGNYVSIDDGNFAGGIFWVCLDACNYYGFTSPGTLYNLGSSSVLNNRWDTTNNEYEVINFNLSHEFSNHLVARLYNRDSSNSSSQKTIVSLAVYVASKRIKLWSKKFWSGAVEEIKDMINKKFGGCSAVISDYSIDEDFKLVDKEEMINRLTIFVDNETYKKYKDKIVNYLIKKDVVYDIIERPRPSVKIRQ